MFVTIVGKQGTEQTLKNVTGVNIGFGKDVARVDFSDGQGDQHMDYELANVESITWHVGEERKTIPGALSGEPFSG